MNIDNPYAPPTAEVSDPALASSAGATLETGVAGEYDFTISEVVTEAWEKTSGMKGIFWGAAILVILSMIAISFVLDFLIGLFVTPVIDPDQAGHAQILISVISELVYSVILYPLMAGLLMIGVHRAAELSISFMQAFGYAAFTLPLIVVGVLITIITGIGYVLLVLPGIYLSVAYLLAVPLIIEKRLSPWDAMEASRKAITHHWFKTFFLFVVMSLLIIVSLIPLGLGLIWTYPMLINVMGILYREIFGVEAVRSL